MAKAPRSTKLQQSQVLASNAVKMSIRDIAKNIRQSKSVLGSFLKNPATDGTKKSTGRPSKLKAHDFTRLTKYAATGKYSVSELQNELYVDASVRTVQREL